MVERNIGGLENLVSSMLGVIESAVSPVTKYVPETVKNAYSSTKNVFLEYTVGVVDSAVSLLGNMTSFVCNDMKKNPLYYGFEFVSTSLYAGLILCLLL